MNGNQDLVIGEDGLARPVRATTNHCCASTTTPVGVPVRDEARLS
ncbi:hypothetical protein QJS66_18225 [Kocuria rhizophila]|nr:hypothetical protein QJS66_18225 [Kocuria rhizophila]